MAAIAERSEIGVPAPVPWTFAPESVVHPPTGPTARVRAGVTRNLSAVPELFADRALSVTRSFQETEGQPLAIRRAKMIARILADHPIVIHEGEVIVGTKTRKPRGSPVFPEINCAWVERDLDRLATRSNTPFFVDENTKHVLRTEVFPYWAGRQVADRIMDAVPLAMWRADDRGVFYHYFRSRTIGHINAGYEKVLLKGFDGIKADAERVRAALSGDGPADVARREFLGSVTLVCEAAAAFARRHASALRVLAQETDDANRRVEVLRMAAACERVPAAPARTFHEALQSMWFTHLVLNLETDGHAFGPGRFDQYLYPYFRHSIDSNELTADQAQELLDLMWVKFDEITLAKDSGEAQTSSSYPEFQNLNVGGLTRDGRDATNELSYMCLTALEHTRLPQPGLSAQISSRTSSRFLLRCCELLRLGLGMPAIFNSDVLVLGMVNRGKTLEDARGSSLNGCVACFCDGKDRMASSGYFNLAKCLELALNDGVDRLTGERLGPATGDPRGFATFDDVLAAFVGQIDHFAEEKARYDAIVRQAYADHCPVPFTSAVIDDCVDRALDWHAGGARYNISTVSGVAIGTVADALSAIRTHVFEKRTVSMAALVEALDRNWDGHELLREMLVNKTPHYGNDDDRVGRTGGADATDLLRRGGGEAGRAGRALLRGPAAHDVAHRPGRGDGRDAGRAARRDAAVRGGVGGAGARSPGTDRRAPRRWPGWITRAPTARSSTCASIPIACARRRTFASWRRSFGGISTRAATTSSSTSSTGRCCWTRWRTRSHTAI